MPPHDAHGYVRTAAPSRWTEHVAWVRRSCARRQPSHRMAPSVMLGGPSSLRPVARTEFDQSLARLESVHHIHLPQLDRPEGQSGPGSD